MECDGKNGNITDSEGEVADLWAEVNAGERRSPQVALFCNTAISLPAEFMQALEASIVSVRTPAPSNPPEK